MATSAFGKAFAAASKAGKKTFSHGGKKYTTEKAKDTPKKGPVPQSRQGADKGSGGRSTATKAAPASKPAAKPTDKKPTVKSALAIQTKPQNKSYAERTKKPASTAKKGGGGGGW